MKFSLVRCSFTLAALSSFLLFVCIAFLFCDFDGPPADAAAEAPNRAAAGAYGLVAPADGGAPAAAAAADRRRPFGARPPACLAAGALMAHPMTAREAELRRLYALVDAVMKRRRVVYWPVDGTLLGILRQGRVANDLDLDFAVMTSIEECGSLLQNLLNDFRSVTSGAWTKISRKKRGAYRGIAVYGMLRFHHGFGNVNTGADFSCVYRQPDNSLAVFKYLDLLMKLPPNTLPLVPCQVYDLTAMCPGNGYAYLAAFAPRYDGCIVFPHCFGDPETLDRSCGTPHPPVPLEAFVKAGETLERCNYANLMEHYRTHPYCRQLMLERNLTGCCDPSTSKVVNGNTFYFLQKFYSDIKKK